MAGFQPCHLRLNAPVQRFREHFDVLESTEVSAVPTEMLMRDRCRRVASYSNYSVQVVLLHVLLRLWCPLRLSQGSTACTIRFCCGAGKPCDCSALPLNVMV